MVKDSKKLEIIKLYNEGNSIRGVAKTVGVGITTVHRVLKNHSVPVRIAARPTEITAEIMADIKNRIDNGELKQDIAKSLGITPSAISKRLKKYC